MVNAVLARERHGSIHAMTFDYGQRAAAREIAAAKQFCDRWHFHHTVIALPWLQQWTRTALVNPAAALPTFTPTDQALNDWQRAHASASAVWVPNRNGVFIQIAAALAESVRAEWIVTGFNAEEATTFPDNTAEFVARTNAALALSTLSVPQVVSYTQAMTKAEIVQCACVRDVPLRWCWPCYEGGETWCGQCESCARFQRALATTAGVTV